MGGARSEARQQEEGAAGRVKAVLRRREEDRQAGLGAWAAVVYLFSVYEGP